MNPMLYNQRKTIVWNITLFVIIIVMSGISLLYTYDVLMRDAKKMGTEMVENYAAEEEQTLLTYKNLINFGASYIDKLIDEGKSDEDIKSWLQDYYKILGETVGTETIDLYAVKSGTVFMELGHQLGDFDVNEALWYQDAIAAGGRIAYTDAYFSEIYKQPVITISKVCGNMDMMIAFVIFPENFRIHVNTRQLPENGSYFMCDSEGIILYAETDLEPLEEEQDKEQFQTLCSGVFSEDREGQAGYTSYRNADGRKIAAFYKKATNGWYSILTIPESSLLENWMTVVKIYGLLLFTAMYMVLFVLKRERRNSQSAKKVTETVYMLGNSYYALYRVNIKAETYEIIKAPDDIRKRLPQSGAYDVFCDTIKDNIQQKMADEFMESFSIENMKKQIDTHVEEFGGDFQRLFGSEYKWVNVRMLFAPSYSKDEIVLCFRKVDLERQKGLQRMQLLEHTVKIANESKNSQKQFFSNMSHDMRTPLNVIIGMSDLAGKNIDNKQKVEDYLKKINHSSKQLMGLINDILEISRLEQKINFESEQFNLREFLGELLNVFQIQAAEAGKIFEVKFEIAHEEVCGDTLRFSQILNNLVSNALKFTGKGDCISVEVYEIGIGERAAYRIVVADTGRGMSEEFVKRIFDPYKREQRFASQVEGSGLGMSIVKSIVMLMGGEIDVKSEVNKGTTFTITVPFEIADGVGEVKKQKISAKKQSDTTLAGKRILLVEDYNLNMELATDILTMNGAEVLQAVNGKEAVERFMESEEFSIDAILMDMHMPVMDGCEATRKIRALSRKDAAVIPIIALTANAFPEDISQTLNAGMNAHITKPIDVKILCSTLSEYVQCAVQTEQKAKTNIQVKKCYDQIGGDYDEVLERLGEDVRVEKYLGKFLEDKNFRQFCEAMDQKDYRQAFAHIHNLKGVCMNLSFAGLYPLADELCEALRSGEPKGNVEEMYAHIITEYENTAVAIRQTLSGM